MRNLRHLIFNWKTEPHNGWSLSAKLTAAYSILIVMVAGTLATSLYLHLLTAQRQAIRDRLLDIVSLTIPQMDSDYHSLIVTPADEQRPYYKILQQRLQAIQTASPDIKRLYTLRQEPDRSIVVVMDYAPPPYRKVKVGQKLTKLTPTIGQGLSTIDRPVVEQNLLENSAGKEVLYGYAPINDPLGRREGVLAIELDASDIINSQNQAKNLALLTFLVTLPLALGVGWWLGRRLISPIEELVEGAEAIAQGQLDLEVKVRSKDEVGVLASAFNHMSHQLKQSFHTLEAKVAQRTAQLQQANQEIISLNERLKAENIRMSAELEVTRQLQKMILPKEEELSQISELDIAGFMEPADEVGGDYYDILQQNGNVRISIGDVTGHGLESGVLAIMVQTSLRTLMAHNETDPVKVLNTLNRTIYDNIQRMNSDKNLTLSLLDYRDGILSFSGQHEEIVVVRASGEVERIDTIDLGFPIGLEENISDFVSSAQLRLHLGDIVVLYTDGITEAENMNKKHYSLERLIEVVKMNGKRSAKEIRQNVIDDVRQHIGRQKVYDDITLVVLKLLE